MARSTANTIPPPRVTLDEQLRRFDRMLDAAYSRVQVMLEQRRAEIVSLAQERLDEGFHLYGDTVWQAHPQALDVDTFEELADALVYQVVRQWVTLESYGYVWTFELELPPSTNDS